jgi:RNA polymerase sigma factor (TIGR02999 family)
MPNPNDAHTLPALMDAAAAGDALAGSRLFEALYHELHRMARRELHARAGGVTLGATTLLHETWLSLSRRGVVFPDRGRFFAYAARAMRGLIIDQIRARRAVKRGGAFHFTAWDTEGAEGAEAAEGALPMHDADALGEALQALGKADPALAELVDLRFFGGLDIAEIAALRGCTERTVGRDWAKARLFLRHALRDE